jgi:hypothetical protein
MITIELTTEKLEHLTEGAEAWGRCSLIVESTEGDDVAVVVSNHRRPRRYRRQAAGTGLGEAGANHEPADAAGAGAAK